MRRLLLTFSVSLLLSFVSVVTAQKNVLFTSLEYSCNYAYYEDQLFTGNAIRYVRGFEASECIRYYNGLRHGTAICKDLQGNVSLINYNKGLVTSWHFVAYNRDTLFSCMFLAIEKITQVECGLYLEDFPDFTIDLSKLRAKDSLELIFALRIQDAWGNVSLEKLPGFIVSGMYISWARYFNDERGPHVDCGWQTFNNTLDRQTIQGLCLNYTPSFSIEVTNVSSYEGVDFRPGVFFSADFRIKR